MTKSLDFSPSIFKPFLNKKKRISLSDQKYTCKVCKKNYYGYSSLYTHFRNKHNIIKVSKRDELFKRNINPLNNSDSFRYNAPLKNFTLNENFLLEINENIKKLFKEIAKANKEFYQDWKFVSDENLIKISLKTNLIKLMDYLNALIR